MGNMSDLPENPNGVRARLVRRGSGRPNRAAVQRIMQRTAQLLDEAADEADRQAIAAAMYVDADGEVHTRRGRLRLAPDTAQNNVTSSTERNGLGA